MEKQLPAYDGSAVVNWRAVVAHGCKLKVSGVLIASLSGTTAAPVVTRFNYKANDKISFEEKGSLCAVYSIEIEVHCASDNSVGWWYGSMNCHRGLLTGTYPAPGRTNLPAYALGVGINGIVGDYSSLQSLEMMIKPDTPYNSQGEGPIATVATCADLATVSTDCARRCIDRPMVHGGQHAMGTCGRLVHAVFQSCCTHLCHH